MSGFGVFAIGRNHPAMRDALKSVLDADLPNLVQMDVSTLAGVLAERLLKCVPYLDKVFFANSGAEMRRGGDQVRARRHRPPRHRLLRPRLHGLTYGALSLNGRFEFPRRLRAAAAGLRRVPFNDLAALETGAVLARRRRLHRRADPGQGRQHARRRLSAGRGGALQEYGTLFVADEIQTGIGRTGRFLAVEHWNVEPDMVLLAKALSGGHVPVGAVLTRKCIFDKIFNRMDRAVVHGSTFAKNDLAMAAGIATLEVMEAEKLIETAAKRGAELRLALTRMVPATN